MALMNNFDFYLENIDRAKNADGTLEKQQKIYEESWEAASKRVKASIEDIYQSLIDDKFFIKLTNGFSGFLELINNTIDSLGGLKGVLLLIGSIITKTFAEDMSRGLSSFATNLKTFTPEGKKQVINEQFAEKREANQALRNQDGSYYQRQVNQGQADVYDAYINKTSELLEQDKVLSEEEARRKNNLIDEVEILGQQVAQMEKLANASEEQTRHQSDALKMHTYGNGGAGKQGRDLIDMYSDKGIEVGVMSSYQSRLRNLQMDKNDPRYKPGETYKNEKAFLQKNSALAQDKVKATGKKAQDITAQDTQKWSKEEKAALAYLKILEQIEQKEQELEKQGKQAGFSELFDETSNAAESALENMEDVRYQLEDTLGTDEGLNELRDSAIQTGEDLNKTANAVDNFETGVEGAKKGAGELSGQLPSTADGVVALGSVLMNCSMALTSFIGLMETWNNEDISIGEKLITTFTTLGLVVPLVTQAFSKQNIESLKVLSNAIKGIPALFGFGAAEVAAGAGGEAAGAGFATAAAGLWSLLWPILAVMAGFIALGAAISLIIKAVNAESDAAIKNAEVARENNEELQEQVETAKQLADETENLADAYSKAKASGEDVSETYKELMQNLQDTYDAYKELDISSTTLDMLKQAEALGLATGNWDDYKKAIREANKEADKAKGKSAYETVYKEASGAWGAFVKGQGHNEGNGEVERHAGAVGTDKEVTKIINNEKYNKVFETDGENEDDTTFTFNTKNPAKFLEQYKLLGEALNELEVAGKTGHDTYRELKAEYDAMADYAASIVENIDLARDYSANSALEEANIVPENISNIDDYNAVLDVLSETLVDLYGDEETATNAAKEFLQGFENTAPFQTQLDFLERYKRKLEETKTATDKLVPISQTTDYDYSQDYDENGNEKMVPSGEIEYTPTYNKDEINNMMADLNAYIGTLSQDELNTLSFIDLSEINLSDTEVSGVDQLKEKIAENFVQGIEVGLSGKLSTAAFEFDFDADELQELGDAFLKMARNGEKGYEGLDKNSELAKDAVVQYARLNRGVTDLSDNYEDYAGVLSDVKKSSNAIDKAFAMNTEAGKKLKSSLADILNTEKDLIDVDLIDAINPKDLENAAKGDAQAIQNIRNAFIDLQAETYGVTDGIDDFKNAMANLEDGATIDLNTMPFLQNLINAKVAAGADAAEIQNLLSGIGIDADISDFVGTAQEAADIAAETGSAIVQNMSTEATIHPVEAEQQTEGEQVAYEESFEPFTVQGAESTVLETMVDGSTQEKKISTTVTGYKKSVNTTPVPLESKTVTSGAGVEVKTANGETPSLSGVKIDNLRKQTTKSVAPTTNRNISNNSKGGSGGGGGGSKKTNKPTTVKPTEKKKKNDEVERYHEINEVLEDLQNNLDEIGELKEEAFGVDKLALMDKEKKKLEELVTSHKKYQSQIAKNLNDDKWEAAQVGAEFDENGRITNYEALQEQWMNEWNTQAATFDAREQDIENRLAAAKNAEDEVAQDALEEEKDKLSDERDAANEAYENKRKALEQYEDTLNLSEEAKRQLEDYLRQIRQLNYEKLEYKLEIRVELNESDLADIEHQLSRLSENDYTRSAERIALISSEAQTYKLMADDQQRFIEELKAQYAAGDINQSDFIEGLKKAKDAILEAETQIREEIVAVGDELRNAFSDAADELDAVYERMQRRLDFADFYKDISIIINGRPDYQFLNSMLNSQTSMLNTRIDGRINERDALIRKQQELYTEMNNAISEEEKAQIRETLDQVESRIADLNSDIQSDIQTLAEYAQTKFENAIEEIADTWQEQNFGESLSAVLEDIDLRNRAQEELLTKTNQVYETNKLIRQAEKDIAATTNKRAKQAYEEYINKAKQKQEQKELTQLELDLLTAEYEITKAQIALEEAKDAKDTVRLTRDSEGNFGYVYTANQDKISDAQQALDDATNNYYNIALDGAKSSSEQIYQLQEEWLEKVKEINLDATLSEEQKQAKIAEITEYYETMMTQQREKYYIAKGAIEESSYAHELDYNLKSIADAENWFDTKDGLINDMTKAEQAYQTDIENVSDKVKLAYGNQKDALDYVDKATEQYGKDLDTLIPKMETDLTKAIETATLAWGEYADKLREVIELSNQVMKDTHDTLLKETYKDDYAAQIEALIKGGANYEDYDVQRLLEYRWEKMGGVDNINYQELINNGDNSTLTKWLQRFKIEQTDWSASGDSWADERRVQKLEQNYADLIENYLSSGYGRWTDAQVQKYLAERQVKMNELGEAANKWATNEELKAEMQKKYPKAFDTGGYTGDWGPEGRMAILHEKELVLNADDTKNILTSVGIIREISKALDNSALWSALGMANLNASYIAAGGSDILQQEVTIHADFPNVQDHNEIEMAIDNLINAASQYAYRN